MNFSSIMEVLGGMKILNVRLKDQYDLIGLSCHGIPKNALLHLANYLSFSTKQISELLPVTERTLQRYSPQQRLSPVISEHVLQIAEVAAKGKLTFYDKEKFLTWMNTPNTALGNRTPLSLLKTHFGIEMVLNELGRIEYGIIS